MEGFTRVLQRFTTDYASHRTFVFIKYGMMFFIIKYIVPPCNLYWILENFAHVSLTRKQANCHGTHIGTLYGTVKCLTVRTVPCRTVPYRTVMYHITILYRLVRYRKLHRTVPYGTVPVPSLTVPGTVRSLRYHTVVRNGMARACTVRYRTVSYGTVPVPVFRKVCTGLKHKITTTPRKSFIIFIHKATVQLAIY